MGLGEEKKEMDEFLFTIYNKKIDSIGKRSGEAEDLALSLASDYSKFDATLKESDFKTPVYVYRLLSRLLHTKLYHIRYSFPVREFEYIGTVIFLYTNSFTETSIKNFKLIFKDTPVIHLTITSANELKWMNLFLQSHELDNKVVLGSSPMGTCGLYDKKNIDKLYLDLMQSREVLPATTFYPYWDGIVLTYLHKGDRWTYFRRMYSEPLKKYCIFLRGLLLTNKIPIHYKEDTQKLLSYVINK